MAQYNANTSQFLGQTKTLFEINMLATESGDPVTSTNRLPVDIGNTTINISGNVNVITPEVVTVNSTPENPVHVHITEIGNTDLTNFSYMPIGGNVAVTSISTGNVSIYSGNIAVTGIVNVGNIPASQNVVVTSGNLNANVSGNVVITSGNVVVTGSVNVGNIPASQNVLITNTILAANVVGIVNVGNIPASQNVVVTSGNLNINSIVTVITTEESGDLYSFNNHAINTNRGWTMDDTMRPVVSFRNGSANIADLIKIIEYEIGNNNANQSTIVYEWYEGDIAITGAAIPAWTTFGVHSQYRIYQDKYSSNQGNTFTPNGAIMRHSGIIIGKNATDDEGPASMHGGATPNMLTLCMRRVDNSTKLDVWFAFTIKELA